VSRSESEPVTPKGRRTRVALLDAGAVVAERLGLAGLSVIAVAEEAGVAKGTFYVHFADRDSFIDALHQQFYARVSKAVADAVQGLEPGVELLLRAVDAYLDVCLANRAVKALVLETRAQGELTTTMHQREELFAALAQPSLAAMGMTPAPIAARLFIAMTSEAALIEMEAGHRVSAARATIRRLATARPSREN
jgi:TetR/AcrR family transcriptional repressor of nem operon